MDKKRKERLKTKDAGFSVEAYVSRSTSAFYAEVGHKKTLKTVDAFYLAAQRYPDAALFTYCWRCIYKL